MIRTDQATHNGFSHISNEEVWPGIDSRYRLIVVAALRSKQLQRGSLPRIEVDPQRRKHTSIALEEVKQGLVPFTTTALALKENGKHPARQDTLVLTDG
jgi:DNA-directed RNA polymerase omega subunit